MAGVNTRQWWRKELLPERKKNSPKPKGEICHKGLVDVGSVRRQEVWGGEDTKRRHLQLATFGEEMETTICPTIKMLTPNLGPKNIDPEITPPPSALPLLKVKIHYTKNWSQKSIGPTFQKRFDIPWSANALWGWDTNRVKNLQISKPFLSNAVGARIVDQEKCSFW